MKTVMIIIAILFLGGCGLYDDTFLDSSSPSNYTKCEDQCGFICDACYSYPSSVYFCTTSCRSNCLRLMCYLNVYSSSCAAMYQDVCTDQY